MRSLPLVSTAPVTVPCESCIAGCCRGFALVIEGFDAYRIGRGLGLPLIDFLSLRWMEEPDEDHCVILDGRPDAEKRFHRLMLQRIPDTNGEHTQRCMFLVTVGARARCGIYEHRPIMCRTYPTWLKDGIIGTSGGKFCPPNVWTVESLDVPKFRARHQFRARQRVIYVHLVEAWNARVHALQEKRTAADFFRYLFSCYGELERRQPAWLVELEPGELDLVPPPALQATLNELLRDLGWLPDAAPA
jgi:Fe-S-cluster containining protein